MNEFQQVFFAKSNKKAIVDFLSPHKHRDTLGMLYHYTNQDVVD